MQIEVWQLMNISAINWYVIFLISNLHKLTMKLHALIKYTSLIKYFLDRFW
jgi:hypothetical protein